MGSEQQDSLAAFERFHKNLDFDDRVRFSEPVTNPQLVAEVNAALATARQESGKHLQISFSHLLRVMTLLNSESLLKPSEISRMLTEQMINNPQQKYYLNMNEINLNDTKLYVYVLQIGSSQNSDFPHGDPARWLAVNRQGRVTRVFLTKL